MSNRSCRAVVGTEALESRRLLAASLVSVQAYQDIPIAGVGDTVWSAHAPATCLPIADGIVATSRNLAGLRLTTNFLADAKAWRAAWSWSIGGTALSAKGEFSSPAGAAGSQSRDMDIPLPARIGQYNLKLRVVFLDSSGAALGAAQTMTHRLHVTWTDPIGATTPQLAYLQKATAFAAPADGASESAADVLSDLNTGIYTRSGWSYYDEDNAPADLITGQTTVGNCFSVAGVWVALAKTLGIAAGYESEIRPADNAGFVTKRLAAFDGQRGNAHLVGGPMDRWVLFAHWIGKAGGRWYDPTFGQVYTTSATQFIDWYRRTDSNVTAGGEADLRQKSWTAWGEWEYRMLASDAPVPFYLKPLTLKTAGATTIQAEDFDIGRDGLAYHDTDSSNGGQTSYRYSGADLEGINDKGGGYSLSFTRAGEWENYTSRSTVAGTYVPTFRVASDGLGGTFHLELDDKPVTGAITIPNTGGWAKWKTIAAPGFAIPAGQHVLSLVFDTDGASGSVGNVNWLQLRKTATGYTTVQAEKFNDGAEGVAYHDSDAANRGSAYRSTGVDIYSAPSASGGYAVGWVRPGEWLKYSVNLAASGSYAFDFRLAAGLDGATFHLEIDGVNKTGPIAIPTTGSWQTFALVSQPALSLSAGQHTLRIVFDQPTSNGNVANFDSFRFARLS